MLVLLLLLKQRVWTKVEVNRKRSRTKRVVVEVVTVVVVVVAGGVLWTAQWVAVHHWVNMGGVRGCNRVYERQR